VIQISKPATAKECGVWAAPLGVWVQCPSILKPAGYRAGSMTVEVQLKHFDGNSISCIICKVVGVQ